MTNQSRNTNNTISELAVDLTTKCPWLAPIALPLVKNACRLLGIATIVLPIGAVYSHSKAQQTPNYDALYYEWLSTNYKLFDLGYHQLLSGERISRNVLKDSYKRGMHVTCMQIVAIETSADVIIVKGAIQFGMAQVAGNREMGYRNDVSLPVKSYYTRVNGRYNHKITHLTPSNSLNRHPLPYATVMAEGCSDNGDKMDQHRSPNYLMSRYEEAQNSLSHSRLPQSRYKTFSEEVAARKIRDSEANKDSLGNFMTSFLRQRFN